MYIHRSDHISLLSGYPKPAATQIRTSGLRPARDGYKFFKNPLFPLIQVGLRAFRQIGNMADGLKKVVSMAKETAEKSITTRRNNNATLKADP